jgi:hypothetical protein
MKKMILRLIVISSLVVLLAACFGPKTPQAVSQAFWKAVVHNEADDAVNSSTLTEPKYYDGFAMEWAGYQPSFGKVVIEDKAASIDTEMISPANSGQANRRFTTYLVLANSEWKVDYNRTKQSIHGGPLGELVDKINQVGSDLSQQLASSADAFRIEMERLGKELGQLSEQSHQQASKHIEEFAEQLRRSIKELEESINLALQEKDSNLSDDDKRTLREIADDLDQDKERLSEPSVEAVTRGGESVGKKQKRLEAIDNNSLHKYKKVWRQLSRQLEKDLRQLLDSLSSREGQDDPAKKPF